VPDQKDVIIARQEGEIAGLRQTIGYLEGRLRDAPRGGSGAHWKGCWRVHIDCAAQAVEKAQALLENERESLMALARSFDKEREQRIRAEKRSNFLERQVIKPCNLQEAKRWALIARQIIVDYHLHVDGEFPEDILDRYAVSQMGNTPNTGNTHEEDIANSDRPLG